MKKINSLENQHIDLRNNLSYFNKENDFPKTEPDPGYHWERVNRYKLYKACNSGYHKGKANEFIDVLPIFTPRPITFPEANCFMIILPFPETR